ncbi:MAG: L,D-transpeptidase [Gaiellaceae bacterium]
MGRRNIVCAPLRTVLWLALGATAFTPGAGQADAPAVAWQAPSPAAGSVVSAQAGSKLTVTLSAAEPAVPTAVLRIKTTTRLPEGARLTVKRGNPAGAVLTWQLRGAQIGDNTLSFAALDNAAAPVSAPALTFTVRIAPGYRRLSGVENLSRWAYVVRPATVRTGPSRSAAAVGRLGLWTPENYPNLALTLDERTDHSGAWVHIRLPILPNSRTGWVKRGALGRYHSVSTHLIVNRETTTATLYRNGVAILRIPVGVGQRQWPTPRGEFYIREKLTGFSDPAYGPLAFGTSARSSVLTDWPGGGFIGIHGTDAPSLIPGHISHGCIRLRNAAITHLGRLLPIGTPLTVL